MIQPVLRMVVLFLLCAVAVTLLGGPAFALASCQHSHPAGCHERMPSSPKPVSLQCCAGDQHIAVPTARFSGRPSLPPVDNAVEHEPLAPIGLAREDSLLIPVSPGSPGLSPLRI